MICAIRLLLAQHLLCAMPNIFIFIYLFIYKNQVDKGPERFRVITSAYFRNVHGILFLYDITNMHSFNNVSRWFEGAKRYSPDSCKFILIGTKKDRSDQGRVVSVEMGQQLADQLGMAFTEVSAKTGEGIQEAVATLTEEILAGRQRFGCSPLPLHVPSKDTIARCVALSLSSSKATNNNSSCQLQ